VRSLRCHARLSDEKKRAVAFVFLGVVRSLIKGLILVSASVRLGVVVSAFLLGLAVSVTRVGPQDKWGYS